MEGILELLNGRISSQEVELVRNSLFLILSLPLITTITGVFRHIVGFKSLSIYAPIIITYAFYQFGFVTAVGSYDFLRGAQFGFLLYFFILITAILLYSIVQDSRMHYVPKTTLVLVGSTLILAFVVLISIFGFEKTGLVYIDTFAVLMILILNENFISILSRKSLKSTVYAAIQTLIIGFLGYIFISIDDVKEIILNYTFIYLAILIIFNFIIGRFTGLRLTEYWRFRELLFLNQEEENGNNIKQDETKQ